MSTVTFKDGSPYPNADIKQVKYLLYDATGAVVSTGDATAAGRRPLPGRTRARM